MASYQQVIELVVKGQEQLAKLERRVKELNREADRLRTEPAKAGTGVLAETIKEAADSQKDLNKATKQELLNRIKLNSAVDLYGRRLRQVQTTAAADQAQFKGRIAEIQAAFKAFKTDGDISGIQAVSTELVRILEYSREIQRNEVQRNKSIVRRRDYVRQINEFKAAGLNTSEVEKFLEEAKVSLGTKRFKNAEALEVKIKERLGLLRKEKQQLDANNRAADKRAKSKGQRFQDFALGAGFPLLFGGGAGQVLGGLGGAALGGGFGGQILGSALGQQFEDALARINEIDTATQNLDMDALADSAILVNAELRETVQNFVDLGESQKAVEATAAEVANQTGVLPESVRDAGNAVTLLSNVWDELVARVSGLISLIATPLLSVLTLVLKTVSEIIKPVNFILSLILKSGSLIKGVDEAAEARLATERKVSMELFEEVQTQQNLLDIEGRRVAGNTAAAKLANAQATRDEALAKIKIKNEKDVLAIRRKFASISNDRNDIERDFRILQVNNLADIERQRVLNKFSLDEKEAGLLRQKEIEKEIFEARVRDAQIAQTGIQTQLNEIANEEKILSIRQQTAAATVELERAKFDAQLSTLQLQEQGLQRELEGLQQKNTGFTRQKELINEIAQNQVQQAEIQNEVAKLQNQQGIRQAEQAQLQIEFEVQKLNLQIEMLKLKAQEIKDDDERAAKLAQIAVTEELTLRLTKEMVDSGNKRLKTAVEIARQKDIVADNILRGKLESIEATRVEAERTANAKQLAQATSLAADEAARLNRNMSAGTSGGSSSSTSSLGGVSSTTTYTAQTSQPIDPDVYQDVISRGPYKTPGLLVEALDDAQEIKNLQTAKLAQLSTPQPGAYASPGSYMSNYSPTQVSDTGSVNVTTGPVMQIDDKLYVTMEDLENALTQVASSQAKSTRSYGARRYGGIS